MNIFRYAPVSLFMLVCAALSAFAQPVKFKRADLLGAWVYVESYSYFPSDGRKQVLFGEKPEGIFVILDNGHYSHIIMHPNLPSLRSGKFTNATIHEAEQIAEGVLAHFGTWRADEQAGNFTVRIRKSSFPNIDNAEQVRTIIQLDSITLKYENDLSVLEPGKAKVIALLRRLP